MRPRWRTAKYRENIVLVLFFLIIYAVSTHTAMLAYLWKKSSKKPPCYRRRFYRLTNTKHWRRNQFQRLGVPCLRVSYVLENIIAYHFVHLDNMVVDKKSPVCDLCVGIKNRGTLNEFPITVGRFLR